MSPLDKFLNGHGNMRQYGSRYRGACLACNASNKTTLSIAEGQDGAVLVRCFKDGCDAQAIARSVGLELQDLFPERLTAHHTPGPRRRGMLSAAEALGLLRFEAELIRIAAANLAAGVSLTEQDRARLGQCCSRIANLEAEVHS
ncbi:hypothetical protein [Roseateles sp.]|uniref:hypothetical protein n=1 Tax=Roseateles sp. TaxID=1971397 RepID=UPI00286B5E65|nr:hypothetical protein [Roseateles sp.]